ncbi:hypothetical protein SD37_10345 [Amycolatopsis orientalis]|uniref:Uncharacterized protein n=1 Tax=Amycolatopsis orientalis TaxID=31958 RepID=A0A193BUV4_AMYOR|nr:hypothetical protein SD37_10345 [Amycolatopsis orientalis]
MILHFLAQSPNPFEGIVPNFDVFGVDFNAAWKKLLGGAWGLAFVVVAFGTIRATLELQSAKRHGYHTSVAEHAASLKRSVIGLAVLASLGLIFGAILSVF